MSVPPPGLDPDFARAWLEEQRAYWARFAAGREPAELAAATAAWDEACERWWRNVGAVVPAPLSGAVRAALHQTRVLLRLATTLAEPGEATVVERVADPALLLGAALDALQAPAALGTSDAEQAYLRAYTAMLAELADIARASLAQARARIERDAPSAPREVYAIYAEAIEARYAERAGSDGFARLVGDLVNAQVAALAQRRSARQ